MPRAAAATSLQRFEGFSDEAIQFLLELQAEQSRTWFKAHQDDFVRLCRKPLELFVTELIERLEPAYPGIADAGPHFFRIQRDTRFSKDKQPYKTNLAADFAIRAVHGDDGGHADDHGHGVPGIYVSYGLDGEFVGGGAWHMGPETLGRYRAALDDPRLGARIQSEVAKLAEDGFEISAMEKLKRVPPPYPQDHPRAELLKHKGLALGVHPPEGLSSTRAYLDWSVQKLTAAAPLMRLLDKTLSRA